MAGEENQGAFFNNWKNSALPASGSTISNVQGGYAGFKGGQSTVSGDPFAIDLLNSSPAQIKAIADLFIELPNVPFTKPKLLSTSVC